MISTITFTVASPNSRVYIFALFRIYVPRKGFITLLATWTMVTGAQSFVWL
jgi:hypothetical protein